MDACAANLMRPAIYGAYHHVTVLGKENEPADHVYDVVGGLCENCDKFAVDRALPRIDMGDRAVHPRRGGPRLHAWATTTTASCAPPRCCCARTDRTSLIRRAETPADYFATLGFDGAPQSSLAYRGEPLPMYEGLLKADADAQAAFSSSKAASWRPGV